MDLGVFSTVFIAELGAFSKDFSGVFFFFLNFEQTVSMILILEGISFYYPRFGSL